MAERAVYSLLPKLADLLIEESLFIYGVRDEVEWLKDELEWMKCFLIDAEAKRRRGNELIKNWLRKVREVAQEAEDIIDKFTIKLELKKRSGLLRRIRNYAAFPFELISRHKVGTKIKDLKAKIDHIKQGKIDYDLRETTAASASTTATAADEALQARRKIYPHPDHSTLVVGLDLHKKEIADRLLNPNIKRRCVASIVGIGGLGKTTLANKVYNDIKAEFQVSACISVSQDYKVLEILKGLVNQMMGKTMAELESCAEFELSKLIREFLMQNKYLIVLDDVWSEDVWDQLIRAAIPEVYNGSRVLLTTRLVDLARSIDPTIPPYELPFLNKVESWTLFLNKAFPYREFSEPIICPEELEPIGRRLVKRCGGLPLALEVLGGILSSKQPNSVAWTSVAEHFHWGSTDKVVNCTKILGLSYDNLPHHHLKSCFLYLGVFPEDSVIKAHQLIELWIAEGFVPLSETQLMEDTAHAYLEEMADRSMIQVVDKHWLGGSASVSTLRIHDLFRDLCVQEASENDFFNIYNMTSNSRTTLQGTINIHGKNLQRLVVHGEISTSADFMPPRNLKSILQFGKTSRAPAIIIPNCQLKLLRVIHFVNTYNLNDEKFPEMFDKAIMNTMQLRYLRLSGGRSNIVFLPPSIRNLCNLQTLHLSGNNVSVLPDWLGKIHTLRHLYLDTVGISVSCLADVGSLTNLQTLNVELNASEGGWMERGLKKLVNIQILKVINLKKEQVRVFIDSLRKMKYLSYLEVSNYAAEVIPIELFSYLSENTHLREMSLLVPLRHLPESLHGFPPNLTTLKLWGSKLSQDPMATLEKLPYLRVLELYNSYIGKEMVCTSGNFPRLYKLWLSHLGELEEWRVEDGAMTNLTVLTIDNCTKLITLPEGLQHLRSLKTLELHGYSKDRVRRQVGEDWYKIQHVPHIRLDYNLI